MKKIWRIVVASAVALILAGFCGFLMAKHIFEDRVVIETVEKERIVEKELEITGEMIREEILAIGELATQEYSYREVITYDEAKSFKGFEIPFTQSKFTIGYDGMIKAGIDFSEITVEKDDIKKEVIITLPEVKILSSEIDEKSFELYDEKNSIFNPISVNDVNDSLINLKEVAEKKALEKGLLERAGENARKMIKSFVKNSFGLKGYSIKVQ